MNSTAKMKNLDWTEQLLNIVINKKSLDQFILSISNQFKASKKTTERESEAYQRIFFTQLKNNKALENPSNELLFRLKFLTLYKPSALSLALYAEAIHLRAKYLTDHQYKKTLADFFSVAPEGPSKKYLEYSKRLYDAFNEYVETDKNSSEYLAEMRNTINELKEWQALFQTRQANVIAFIYFLLRFGNYLKQKFLSTTISQKHGEMLAEIRENIGQYTVDFENLNSLDLTALQLTKECLLEIKYGEHELGLSVMNELELGYEGLVTLLGLREKIKPGEQKINLPDVKKFIVTDLIPNTLSRKQIDQIIDEITKISVEKGNGAAKIAKLLRQNYQDYCINPDKTLEVEKNFKNACDNIIELIKKEYTTTEWLDIINRLQLAILVVVWIDQLLHINLDKKSLDKFINKLIHQSEQARINTRESMVLSFNNLFLKKLKDNELIYNPDDELIYRATFLTLINPSRYPKMILNAIIHCRVMCKVNLPLAVKLNFDDLQKDEALFLKYNTSFESIKNEFQEKVLTSSIDSKYLQQVKEFSTELIAWVKNFKDDQLNILKCLYHFLTFGEFLKNKFPDKSLDFIRNELKTYAGDFLKDEKLHFHSFYAAINAHERLEKIYKSENFIPEELALFFTGMHGFIILLHFKYDKDFKNDEDLIRRSVFILHRDLISHTPGRHEINKLIELTEFYNHETFQDENDEAVVKKFITNFKVIAYDYFFNPRKTKEVIETFKTEFEETVKAANTTISVTNKTKWESIATKSTAVVNKMVLTGTAENEKISKSAELMRSQSFFALPKLIVTSTATAEITPRAEGNVTPK